MFILGGGMFAPKLKNISFPLSPSPPRLMRARKKASAIRGRQPVGQQGWSYAAATRTNELYNLFFVMYSLQS